jgi:MoxR-like ATPase
MLLKKNGEDAYFAASNSKHGFYSYYESCFDDARVGRVFAIKGGPGTGKNRFMRDVAEAAWRHSRQVESI